MALGKSVTETSSTVVGPAAGTELPEAVRHELPMRFEVVAEALRAGTSVVTASAEVGRGVARDGATLGEALAGLRATFLRVRNSAPDLESAEALATEWAEATLELGQRQSCEDPLTGFASLTHVRTRLGEEYRDAGRAGTSVALTHALVVVELGDRARSTVPEHELTRSFRLFRLCQSIRTAFGGGETIGRLGGRSAIVLVRRGVALHDYVRLLRGLLDEYRVGPGTPRVRVERLPATFDSAIRLLVSLPDSSS